MPLLPEDRERLIRYLDFLESEGADFPRFSRVDWKLYFDPEFGEDISRWAALRNILAQQYPDIRWQSIDRFLRESESSFRKLAQ